MTLKEEVALHAGAILLCVGPEIPDKLIIRKGSYGNRFTILDTSERIELGRNCMIGPHCYITDHDHGQAAEALVRDQSLVGKAVHIGDYVWIGAGAIILKGVTIGDRAVIGAGAVVTKKVPSGTKVAGVPAIKIGMRS